MTEQEYNKLCREFEDARMYDGRGTTDIYVCEKMRLALQSVYVDKGVTPFTLECRCCKGTMFHRHTVQGVTKSPHIRWVRPTYEQFKKLPNYLQKHVMDGGLVKSTELD